MKAWRNSASLILLGRQGQKYNRALSPTVFQYNYKLLCLKRHQKSSFMPNLYVFPGGTENPADADLKWNDLYAGFGFDKKNFASLFPNTTERPQIFRATENELPKEISLRITAIRETFEECGILLCKQRDTRDILPHWAQHLSVSEEKLLEWQNKVHNDATEFYTLCKTLKCYPDLWALHEWSNWLTPTFFTGRRFDTIFYLACMPDMPHTVLEITEMEDLKWDIPKAFTALTSKMAMGPPQHYEIARISRYESIDNLLDFAVERSKLGVQLYLPIRVFLSDGKVYLLPGDSMYPKEVHLIDKQDIDKSHMTIHEFRQQSPVINRLEFFEIEVKRIEVHNLDSAVGHLNPIPSETTHIKLLNRK